MAIRNVKVAAFVLGMAVYAIEKECSLLQKKQIISSVSPELISEVYGGEGSMGQGPGAYPDAYTYYRYGSHACDPYAMEASSYSIASSYYYYGNGGNGACDPYGMEGGGAVAPAYYGNGACDPYGMEGGGAVAPASYGNGACDPYGMEGGGAFAPTAPSYYYYGNGGNGACDPYGMEGGSAVAPTAHAVAPTAPSYYYYDGNGGNEENEGRLISAAAADIQRISEGIGMMSAEIQPLAGEIQSIVAVAGAGGVDQSSASLAEIQTIAAAVGPENWGSTANSTAGQVRELVAIVNFVADELGPIFHRAGVGEVAALGLQKRIHDTVDEINWIVSESALPANPTTDTSGAHVSALIEIIHWLAGNIGLMSAEIQPRAESIHSIVAGAHIPRALVGIRALVVAKVGWSQGPRLSPSPNPSPSPSPGGYSCDPYGGEGFTGPGAGEFSCDPYGSEGGMGPGGYSYYQYEGHSCDPYGSEGGMGPAGYSYYQYEGHSCDPYGGDGAMGPGREAHACDPYGSEDGMEGRGGMGPRDGGAGPNGGPGLYELEQGLRFIADEIYSLLRSAGLEDPELYDLVSSLHDIADEIEAIAGSVDPHASSSSAPGIPNLEYEFEMAFIPADRCFLCPGVLPGQPSVSCSDMHVGNGNDDVIAYVIMPNWSGPGFLALQMGAVIDQHSPPAVIVTDISWNAMSSEVLHLKGAHGDQILGVVIKGSSIPAGPSSGTWKNTHQPNDQEAVDWMNDNLITDSAEAMAMYQRLGGQMSDGMGLLSWQKQASSGSH